MHEKIESAIASSSVPPASSRIEKTANYYGFDEHGNEVHKQVPLQIYLLVSMYSSQREF